ncbi:Uncharacterised protein [Klebsiella pneumoniae]|uniref:Uncharacterized protein n=1 Tax=Klebsiella pneumoniae TaxID=573 RepID=A0A378H3F1_KLEPN|nr:Uncharacterised protein [Klebsiella pneumoniae]
MYVNYALTVHNSSGRRNIIAHVIAQVMGDSQGDQLSSSAKRASSDSPISDSAC